MAKRDKTERAKSKVETAGALAGLGGAIGSPFGPMGSAIGAGLGGITGLIIGDSKTVFQFDYVAVPAWEYPAVRSDINYNPTHMIYIRAGETLIPTGGNVADLTENMIDDVEVINVKQPKTRKRSKWNIYTSKKKNQIRFKSGKNKGLLNLKAMGKAYRKASKGGKK